MKEKNLDELKLELEELNEKIEDKRLEIKKLEKVQGRKKQFFDSTLNLEKILSDYIIDTNYIYDNSNDESKRTMLPILKRLHSNLDIALKNIEYKINEIRDKNNVVEMK